MTIPLVPRVPLPEEEPAPAHTYPPNPDPYEQRAGDLTVGQWGYVVLYERKRKLPDKTQPFGFVAPDA